MQKKTLRTAADLGSPTLLLLVILATAGALLYFQFLVQPNNRGDIIPYAMVIMAESFIIFHALMSMWTILAGTRDPRNFEFHDAQTRLFPGGRKKRSLELTSQRLTALRLQPLQLHDKPIAIDVFVTVYGEPLETIRETATAARDIAGFHKTYLLDDGKSDAVRQLATELNVGYIRRENTTGAKAGNINNALQHTEGEFFVIFDADFVAQPNFLYETMPFFQDELVAFVQTPQHYSNHQTIIARGAGYMQKLFYGLVLPGKNRFNAAFCVGTNVVFRRSAVLSIGGIYDKSKSEDIWTSLLLHEKGYRSIFIPDVLAVGRTPDTIKAYSKQQLRWSTGGFQILFHHKLLTRPLTIDQKIQYLHTTTYYLHGLAILLLIMLPPLHIFFDLTPVTIHVGFFNWLVFYVLFYGLQILLAFYTMGGFRAETLVLAVASFPIYMRAFFDAVRGKEESWQATGNSKGADSPFNYIVPQLTLFIFLLCTSVVGAWKVYYYEKPSLALVWTLLNTIILGSFLTIALKEHFRLSRPAPEPQYEEEHFTFQSRRRRQRILTEGVTHESPFKI